jgi:signal transduction histidine kinase
MIDEAIHESVRISENLLPSKLRDFDLATCLNSLCNQIEDSSTITVAFESSGSRIDLNQAQKINLYRIAQEAINNAVKHARPSFISVQLHEDEGRIRLTVEDDGRGIPATPKKPSQHGLVNMRERAEIMGGQLTIESDTDRGTLIIAEAPAMNNVLAHAQI